MRRSAIRLSMLPTEPIRIKLLAVFLVRFAVSLALVILILDLLTIIPPSSKGSMLAAVMIQWSRGGRKFAMAYVYPPPCTPSLSLMRSRVFSLSNSQFLYHRGRHFPLWSHDSAQRRTNQRSHLHGKFLRERHVRCPIWVRPGSLPDTSSRDRRCFCGGRIPHHWALRTCHRRVQQGTRGPHLLCTSCLFILLFTTKNSAC